ncbi:MAG TPA: hypothetical protein VMD08_08240 [Candidatus Baltobacteraceae bacterium]|nr:hypothetical protein [Candidatus Baltobacteraceae bacterium]
MTKLTNGIDWLQTALVLAFVLAFLSVGSMGVLHDALHRQSVQAWQRLERTAKVQPDGTRTSEATQTVSVR